MRPYLLLVDHLDRIAEPKHRKKILVLSLTFLLSLGAIATADSSVRDLGAAFRITGDSVDILSNTVRSGFTFQVALRNIEYEGQVDRALLEQHPNGYVTLWLALRNVTLTIQNTDVTSQRRGAQCGPMQIVLGSRQPLWIAFDAAASGPQRLTELTISQVRFELPDDNWQIGTPAWVKTWGIGMNQSSVVSGLRGGLSQKRQEIEAQILRIGPAIFAQAADIIEDRQTTNGLALK